MKLPMHSVRQGRGGYWAWRSNHSFSLSKLGQEREVCACHTVWKYSVLTRVSHTLTLEVTVCRKRSVISSSILSSNPFTLTSWPVLALQMYVSLCQTVLLKQRKKKRKGKYWLDQIRLFFHITNLSTVTNMNGHVPRSKASSVTYICAHMFWMALIKTLLQGHESSMHTNSACTRH